MNQLNYAIDLYFPPQWVKGSLVLSLFSTLVLIGLFAYLNRYTRRDYFNTWMLGWICYAAWIVAWISFVERGRPANLEWIRLFPLGACAFFLLLGTLQFTGHRRGRREMALLLLLILFGNFLVRDLPASRHWLSVVFFAYLAVTSWATSSYYFQKRLKDQYVGGGLLAVGFLLWGFQMLAYPFAHASPDHSSTAFVTASVLQLAIAVGMIVLVLEESRSEAAYLRAQMKTNIRETKSLKRKAQVSEIKYANLFDQASDAILVCDPTTLGVEDANRAAERLTGYSREELKAMTLMKICPWLKGKEKEVIEDPARLRSIVDGMGKLPIERRGGGMVMAEGAVSIIRNNGHSTVELFLREMTEMRQLEQKLRQAEKLSSLGQLISGVAHELNNPLSVIVGYSQLIAERPHLDEKTRNDLQKLQHESERAARIVKNFLAFARRHPAEKKTVDIHQVIGACLELRDYEIKASGVQVEKDFAPNLPGCHADATQLEQVFLNLIHNGIQAMEGVEKKLLRIRTCRKDSMIQVRVEDRGRGIPEELMDSLFDPFFTTKEEGRGTGLGLSISYSIVKEHLGNIFAENNPGGGSTFVVELPAVGAIEAMPAAGPAGSARRRLMDLSGRFHVLVADDEVSIHDLFFEILPEEKFFVETATNGQVAMQLMAHRDFDLIVCDLKMAPLDGRHVFEKAVSEKPHLRGRFIFVTGDTNTPETLKFLDSTGAAWITKPFKLGELEDIIVERLNALLKV